MANTAALLGTLLITTLSNKFSGVVSMKQIALNLKNKLSTKKNGKVLLTLPLIIQKN